MEAALRRLLSDELDDDNSEDDNISEDESMTYNDMLIGQEGLWIEGNHRQLMRIWRGLKGLCRSIMPDQPEVLADASFRVFASFMYRWTAEEGGASSDSDASELQGTGRPAGTPPPPPADPGHLPASRPPEGASPSR